ncbi:MAG: GrpB family protein [Firmicutes bacterium]|nr:GrpB family protein [Bacillota bacterium]
MKKRKLSGMTVEELWQLFPIFLVPYNSLWVSYYNEEKENLLNFLTSNQIKRIEHIGSTAIPNIYAKNIVDILVEVYHDFNIKDLIHCICEAGYIKMSETTNRISFNKGYTENGFAEKVYHLHFRNEGDNDELYFRDYLIDNPYNLKEYESLKLQLWKKFEHDRDGYTNAKTSFILSMTKKAKEIYKDRYQ